MRKTRKKYLQQVPWLLGKEDTGLSMQSKKKWTYRDEQLIVCRSKFWQWFLQQMSCLSNITFWHWQRAQDLLNFTRTAVQLSNKKINWTKVLNICVAVFLVKFSSTILKQYPLHFDNTQTSNVYNYLIKGIKITLCWIQERSVTKCEKVWFKVWITLLIKNHTCDHTCDLS